ncbi:MAG: GntR family transcriptional regulator, partial [Lachnospiraceae bacterium]|nr:GntR family transcriptional regulator [Lachnospiraceae bacterium]
EGFIAAVQGKGSVVLPTDNQLLREQYLLRIEEGLSTAIETARVMGMPKEELKDIFDNLLET